MRTIVQLLDPEHSDPPAPTPGSLSLPSWSLRWDAAGITLHDLETRERHQPTADAPLVVQATRAQHTNTGGLTGMLFGGSAEHWLNVELRHATLGRLRLAARVSAPALLDGLEYLELPAPEVPLEQLTALLQALARRGALQVTRAVNSAPPPSTPRPRPLPSDTVDRHTFERVAGQLEALKATREHTRARNETLRGDAEEARDQAVSHAADHALRAQEAQIEVTTLRAEIALLKAQHHADLSALQNELQSARAELEALRGHPARPPTTALAERTTEALRDAARAMAELELERRRNAALSQELETLKADYERTHEELLDALETVEALEEAQPG